MKKKLRQELESLVQILAHYPKGVFIGELLRWMGEQIPRRTMQYRLSTLVKSGFLRRERFREANKYFLNVAPHQTLGEPDPFRLIYGNSIRSTIYEVVKNNLDKLSSSQFILKFANECVPPEDQKRFVEVAETEVMSLHEGNFAVFKIRPPEFEDWQRQWR